MSQIFKKIKIKFQSLNYVKIKLKYLIFTFIDKRISFKNSFHYSKPDKMETSFTSKT